MSKLNNPEIDNSNLKPLDNGFNQKEVLSKDIIKIEKEKQTIVYLSYLTTLARLWGNRDLWNLFDGELNLWEEELFTIYSLIEIINGANIFEKITPPRKMNMDVNWGQNYDYKLTYQKQNPDSWIQRIQSIVWDGNLPFNETKLNFEYEWSQLNSLNFERSMNLDWVWLEQDIKVVRDWNLAKELRVFRDFELDNNISIQYNSFNKPKVIEQTQIDVLSDKIVFEYDEKWNLKSMVYVPALSLKHLVWWAKTFKKWTKMKWLLKWIELSWQYITYSVLKKIKWVDVIEIDNKNNLPESSKSNLKASNWFYTEWFSKMRYDTKWRLEELYLEMEDIPFDDKKKLKLKY